MLCFSSRFIAYSPFPNKYSHLYFGASQTTYCVNVDQNPQCLNIKVENDISMPSVLSEARLWIRAITKDFHLWHHWWTVANWSGWRWSIVVGTATWDVTRRHHWERSSLINLTAQSKNRGHLIICGITKDKLKLLWSIHPALTSFKGMVQMHVVSIFLVKALLISHVSASCRADRDPVLMLR